MARIAMLNPRNTMPRFSDFLGEDWGWYDYPGNEIDMYEEDDNLYMELKAPGFKENEIDIQVESGIVNITGRSKEEKEKKDKDRKYFRKEIKARSFTRRVDLPFPVNSDESEAELSDGILKLKLPKSNQAKPKSIKVKTK